LKLTF